MAFTVKKGDLVYAADGTLGFVSDVFRPREGSDADAGWAVVDVTGLSEPTYFTASDVASRDESVPSVLLKLTYAEATDEAHRRQPEAVARGKAKAEEIPPLDVGRPEIPRATAAEGAGGMPSTEPARPPQL